MTTCDITVNNNILSFNNVSEIVIDNIYRTDYDDKYILFIIPKGGDLLLNIELIGKFNKAIIYQYNNNKKHIYQTIYSKHTNVLNPFKKSGILLFDNSMAFSVLVNSIDMELFLDVSFAYLKKTSMKFLENNYKNLKLSKNNGDIYNFNCKNNHIILEKFENTLNLK